jgi:hypothetical protein
MATKTLARPLLLRLVDAVALANATTSYVIQHRTRLRTEAKLILSSTEEKL